jgi:hypothetical protein
MRNKKSHFFTYYFYIIILVVTLSFTLSYYCLNLKFTYKKNQIFNFFTLSYQTLDDNQIIDKLASLYQDDIKEFNLYNFTSSNKNLTSYYTRFGASADLLILSSDDLSDMDEVIKENFIPLDNLHLDSFYQYYTFDEVNYGIKVYQKGDETYNVQTSFSSCFDFASDGKDAYYLLININSLHFQTSDDIGYAILDSYLEEVIQYGTSQINN